MEAERDCIFLLHCVKVVHLHLKDPAQTPSALYIICTLYDLSLFPILSFKSSIFLYRHLDLLLLFQSCLFYFQPNIKFQCICIGLSENSVSIIHPVPFWAAFKLTQWGYWGLCMHSSFCRSHSMDRKIKLSFKAPKQLFWPFSDVHDNSSFLSETWPLAVEINSYCFFGQFCFSLQ